MNTTPRERLKAIEQRLIARGMSDIKFTWAEGAHEQPFDQVVNGVCDVLEAYLDGEFSPLPESDDSQRATA